MMNKVIIGFIIGTIMCLTGGFYYYQQTKPERLLSQSIKEYQKGNYIAAINTITKAIHLKEKNDFFSARCEYSIKNLSFSGVIDDCEKAYKNKDSIKNNLFDIEENYSLVLQYEIEKLYKEEKYNDLLQKYNILKNIQQKQEYGVYECASYIKLFDLENAITKCKNLYENKDLIQDIQLKKFLFSQYSNLLIEQEDWEDVNKIIQEGKSIDKNNLDLYIQEGYYLFEKKEYQKSIDSFLKGLESNNITDKDKIKIYTYIAENYYLLDNNEQFKIYLQKAEILDKENIYVLATKGKDVTDGFINYDIKLSHLLTVYNKINTDKKNIFQSQKTFKIDIIENILMYYWIKGDYEMLKKYSQEVIKIDENNKFGNFVFKSIQYIQSESEKEYKFLLEEIQKIVGLKVEWSEIILMDVYMQSLTGVNPNEEGYEEQNAKNMINVINKLKKQNEASVGGSVYEEIKMFANTILLGLGKMTEKEFKTNYQNILKVDPNYDLKSDIEYWTEKMYGIVENLFSLID